ncbi:helix-turn-helix domain-containing protein [Pseudomonas sp. NyZ704]|nr:helix-turn-helix domain-containing protein [Pseudomonas sp. NyZ704]
MTPASNSDSQYTIGQLAKATDTKAVTIRYYEGLGLLPSYSRSAAGYRLYTTREHDRLLFIRRSRGLGFSIEDIRGLLGLADRGEAPCTALDAKVKEQLEQVRLRLRDLRAMEQELERLSGCCAGGVISDCRIVESLSGRG